MRFLVLISAACVAFGVAATASADAAGLNFFEPDSARTVFGPEVEVVKAGQIDKGPKGDTSARVAPAGESKAKDGGTPFDPETATADDIVGEFGDPEKNVPVLAVENAPRPFQAMMRAIEVDEPELAYQYARQYVRYLGQLQERQARIMSLVQKSMYREGMAEAAALEGGPDFIEDREVLERDLKASGISRDPELDKRTRELLAEAQSDEDRARRRALTPPGSEGSIVPDLADDQAAQAAVNSDPSSTPSPGSQPIAVYFFFSPQDSASQQMSREIELLYRSGRKLNLIGLTTAPARPGELAGFRQRTRSTWPMHDGTTLAAALKLSRTPTVVFTDPVTRRSIVQDGVRSFAELAQVLTAIERGTPPSSGGKP